MATEPQPEPEITPVLGDELLYRAVKDTETHHVCDGGGRLVRLLASAFNDPDKKPSVDRAIMRGDLGPAATRQHESDGVVAVVAEEVRAISSVKAFDAKGENPVLHAVDVQHRPLATNYSHSQVEAAPNIRGDGAFKKLKEALCYIANTRGWTLPPASSRRAR